MIKACLLLLLAVSPLVAAPDSTALGSAVLDRYGKFSAEEKQAAVAALAARPATAHLLLDAIAAGSIPRTDLPSLLARQISEHGDQALTEKLTKQWGAVGAASADAGAEAARLEQLLTPEFLATADLPAGRVLYSVTCGTCHKFHGVGQDIGPDITGSNRAQLSYLIENIADPGALVGRDYELHIFSLQDSRVVAGLVREETDAAWTVRTLTGTETVARSAVKEHRKPGISLMPAGQLAPLSREQQRDLVAYLMHPGQVPLPGEPGAEKYVAMGLPGAMEGESMTVLASSSGQAGPQNMAAFARKGLKWNGGSQLWWTGARPGDRLDLRLPVAETGAYDLKLILTKAPDYGTVRLLLDGKPLGEPVDCFSPSSAGVVHTGLFTAGTAELTAGDHRLTLEITGANPEAVKAWMVGLDCVWLQKKSAH